MVKTLQFLLYLLRANDAHVITVTASAPGHAEWGKSMLANEITRLEGEVLNSEALRQDILEDNEELRDSCTEVQTQLWEAGHSAGLKAVRAKAV